MTERTCDCDMPDPLPYTVCPTHGAVGKPPGPPTKRVRIAVAINEYGEWSAHGQHDVDEPSSMAETHANIADDGDKATFFVVADVPIPQRQTIKGTLEVGKP